MVAVSSCLAKPGVVAPFAAPLAYSVPLAQSSQVFARNYNGIAAAPIVAAPAPVARFASPVLPYAAAPAYAAAAPYAAALPYTAAALALPYSAYSPYAATAFSPYSSYPYVW